MAFVVCTSPVIAWFIEDQATAHINRLRERAKGQTLQEVDFTNGRFRALFF